MALTNIDKIKSNLYLLHIVFILFEAMKDVLLQIASVFLCAVWYFSLSQRLCGTDLSDRDKISSTHDTLFFSVGAVVFVVRTSQ